ncbi:MAG: hypothetical protein ACI9ON_003237, partial [Limisphaerales bacterium]
MVRTEQLGHPPTTVECLGNIGKWLLRLDCGVTLFVPVIELNKQG